MIKCRVCGADCEDGAVLCPVCGAELEIASSTEESAEPEQAVLNNPVLAVSIEDVVSAEIFEDILKDNGIAFACDRDFDDSMKVVFGGGFIAADVYVEEEDLDKVKRLYDEFLESEPDFGSEDYETDESI